MRSVAAGALAFALLLAAPRDAAAYIDPGTGSLILQGLIGAFAIAAVTLRGYWYRIKAFFRGERGRKPADAAADGTRSPAKPQD